MQPKTPKLLEDIRDAAAWLVWSTIEEEVPVLLTEVESLLGGKRPKGH